VSALGGDFEPEARRYIMLQPLVVFGREKANGGERGIRTPCKAPDSLGKTEDYTGKDTGFSIVLGHDLSQVVKAWPRLNGVLKAAILAIASTATDKGGQ
jgi:hypothetical protein